MNRRNWIKFLGAGSLAGILPWSWVHKGPATPASLLDECLTSDDILGPFYIPNTAQGMQIAPEDAPGSILFMTGTIYARDCQTPVAQAKLEIWQASDGGDYSDDHYRGTVLTDDAGNYSFVSVLPGKYLNGSQFRPRHLHYKASSAGTELVTQIYFEGDTSIPNDPWASQDDAAARIIELNTDANNALHGVADIYLDVTPITSNDEERPENERAHLRGLFPQPLPTTGGQIEFYLDRPAKISLQCLDLQARLIQTVVPDQQMGSGQHSVAFLPENQHGLKMPKGIYVLRMYVDKQVVDAKRVIIS